MGMNAEQLKVWRQAGREFMAADGPTTVNVEQRTVDVVWFSGADVQRLDWWTGELYILHFDPKGADLSLLNAGAPVLDHHMTCDGAEGQMGRVDRAWVAKGQYLATLRFSRRPDLDGLWMDIQDGIVTKFSMGVELMEVTEQRDQTGKLTAKTAVKWRPFEISVEPIPADFGTTTLAAQPGAGDASAHACAARVREIEILLLG